MYFMNLITNWGKVAVFNEVYDYGTDLAGYIAKLFIAFFTASFCMVKSFRYELDLFLTKLSEFLKKIRIVRPS